MAAPIVIAIGLDTGDAQAAAEKLAQAIRSALDGLGPAAQRAGEKAGDALTKGFANSLKTFQRQISDVGQQLSLKVSLPLGGVGLAALKAAADLDKSRQTLTALTGSIESANRKLAELRELARSSPGVTTQFATSLFAQFKALGTVSDQSINSIIKSLGRLNAVFTLPDPAQFARNLQQIFSQSFERADIKEALGQVPIFEQLLEQAFGTKDAAKLRALKEAGKLTVGGFFDGIGEAINQRFPQVSESILARFQKTKDEVLVALAPLGESLIRTLEPVLLKVIPKVIELLDRFSKLPPAVQEGIIIFGLLTAALGPVLAAFGSLLQIVTSLIALISGAAGLTVAIGALNPVLLVIGGSLAAGALGWYAYSSAVKNATDQIDIAVRKQQESVGVFKNLQGQTTTRSGNVIPEGAKDLFNQMPTGALAPGERVSLGGLTAGQFNPATGRFEGQQQAVRAGLADSIKTVNDKAIQDAKQFKEAQEQLERDRVDSLNRIFRQEAELRIQAFSAQYEQGLITLKEFYDQKQSLESLATTRELAALEANAETLRDRLEKTKLTSMERLDVEKQLIGIYGQQADKVNDLNKTLQQNFDDYKKRLALPSLDLTRTQQEQVTEFVDPRVQAARDKIEQARALQEQRDLSLIDLGRQRIEIENQVEQGVLSQADAREQINALLRQERDLRLAVLEAEKASVDITPQRRAEIESEIASIRNLGVELTAAQRFMRGFNSEVESTGDAFERLGQNISRSFASVKGLLDNLKQSFVTFFRDLLGLGLQKVFAQLFGGLLGGIGGAGRAAGGVSGGNAGGGIGGAITGGLGAIFGGGGGGGFLTPGFGGGFPLIGASLGPQFGGALGGGINVIPFGSGGAAAPIATGAGGGVGTTAAIGAAAGLAGLFRGFGFGRPVGAARGPLAAIAPLLGAQAGIALGGRSGLGQILGGIGGAALGIGLTAAPAALAGGSLGFLAPLFSNPITAVVGGALLVGSILLGRSKQRRTDEEQSGIWLTDAVNGISQLRDQARAGQITLEQARQIFETQILTTFVSQIQTLKTKSVRESRLTNQVRDLRNLFESTVVSAAKTGARTNDINSKLVPEFATGGIVPGIDRGFDSVLAKVRPGEMVLTRNQQSAIQSMAGGSIFRAAGVPDRPGISGGLPAFANGGVMPQLWRNPSQPVQLDVQMNLVVGRDDASALVVSGQTTRAGQRSTVAVVRKAVLEREF